MLLMIVCASLLWTRIAASQSETVSVPNGMAGAHQNTAAPLEFEVATIRPHPAGDFVSELDGGPPGRYQSKNVTVKDLVEEAYGVPADQVSGGPDWLDKQRFDIQAKIPDEVWQKIAKLDFHARQQCTDLMLQSLLKSRFQLAIDKEPKELRVYALVVAKGGPKLRPAGSPKPDSRDEEGKLYAMAMDQPDIPVAQLANFLQMHFRRTVLDQTGLSGRYDISFHVPVTTNWGIDLDTAVFNALEDQLGLKIESRKATVETIVIQHLEQPSAN